MSLPHRSLQWCFGNIMDTLKNKFQCHDYKEEESAIWDFLEKARIPPQNPNRDFEILRNNLLTALRRLSSAEGQDRCAAMTGEQALAFCLEQIGILTTYKFKIPMKEKEDMPKLLKIHKQNYIYKSSIVGNIGIVYNRQTEITPAQAIEIIGKLRSEKPNIQSMDTITTTL